jgi:hypothetical protein
MDPVRSLAGYRLGDLFRLRDEKERASMKALFPGSAYFLEFPRD